eukprot:CAMPEP_0171777554 /NCGR_PEP_ID=MMETSP0991-20121206/57855_1 /TAXON_ID=483369 /ORGANISM="non described non described, Strain CCMP2098" /LENGTH=200 /DNA_ID=CAMNT_0012384299 /DNA_START=128 /DNA_END=726 /DNA_ORIENTATION=-
MRLRFTLVKIAALALFAREVRGLSLRSAPCPPSSFAALPTWPAALEALHSPHVKATVVVGAVDLAPFVYGDPFASAKQIPHGGAEVRVTWLGEEGKLEEGASKTFVGGIVHKLWPGDSEKKEGGEAENTGPLSTNDAACAEALVSTLAHLATEYGKCLTEHGLLEKESNDLQRASLAPGPPLPPPPPLPYFPSSSSSSSS